MPDAFSWDGTGHRIISAIAYEHLTAETKQKVDHLTAVSDPHYPPLMRFLYISTLPDRWRQAGGEQSTGWHFINKPWSADGAPTRPATTPNVGSALEENISALTSARSSTEEKAKALAYVVHLTEDAHQPLHNINRFSKDFSRGDKGGNAFPIHTKYADNLHTYWDQSARQMKPGHTRYPLSNKQVLQLAKMIQADYSNHVLKGAVGNVSAHDWIEESYVIAQQKVYGILPGSKPSAEYKKMQRKVAARQMALAGYRLAELLNQLTF